MSRIVLGKHDGTDVGLDLDVLLRTRLLVQASSGGGKSWLLRRLAEQLFGKIQVLLIDPEGEFATLREKYGYVLVGKGGETPADRRSAALVAHKLLELHASAVCDLYELQPHERHAWVRLFLEALENAPKKLWHPVVVIVDEAHKFAPEKGAGESEASSAMIGLATQGRKRGFCAVFATQRLGKLRKDAAAELLNVLIGQTFIDVDRKRAADALGIDPKEQRAFFADLKLLRPGKFWALGRAVSKDRILVEVGPVTTTHPELGATKFSAEPPPAPEHVKRLLPKLADLPAEAEAKARTEAELKTEIRSLKAQLSARPTVEVPQVQVERVEVPVVGEAMAKRLEAAAEKASAAGGALAEAARELTVALRRASEAPKATPAVVRRPAVAPPRPAPSSASRKAARSNPEDNGTLSSPEQRIVDALAWMESLGIQAPLQTAVAFLAGYSPKGGAYCNPRGRLRVRGLVEYDGTGQRLSLTDAGRALANFPETDLTPETLHERVLSRLPGPEQKILRPLLAAYPGSLSNDELASAAGYAPTGGAYANPRGRLRSLGLIDYRGGEVFARPLLFLEG